MFTCYFESSCGLAISFVHHFLHESQLFYSIAGWVVLVLDHNGCITKTLHVGKGRWSNNSLINDAGDPMHSVWVLSNVPWYSDPEPWMSWFVAVNIVYTCNWCRRHILNTLQSCIPSSWGRYNCFSSSLLSVYDFLISISCYTSAKVHSTHDGFWGLEYDFYDQVLCSITFSN